MAMIWAGVLGDMARAVGEPLESHCEAFIQALLSGLNKDVEGEWVSTWVCMS